MNRNVLDMKNSALLIIDMQEDFARPSGSAYINGTSEIIQSLSDLVAIFRKQNKNIFHIIRLYHPDGSNAELCRKEQIASGHRIVSPASKGADILMELLPPHSEAIDHNKLLEGHIIQVEKNDHVLYKPRWGAFFQTKLHETLKLKSIDTLLIAGCNFPNCPRTTIYEASERDYKIGVIPSTISGIYDKGINELKNIGVQIYSDLSQFER